jgi:hypothetical protein
MEVGGREQGEHRTDHINEEEESINFFAELDLRSILKPVGKINPQKWNSF